MVLYDVARFLSSIYSFQDKKAVLYLSHPLFQVLSDKQK